MESLADRISPRESASASATEGARRSFLRPRRLLFLADLVSAALVIGPTYFVFRFHSIVSEQAVVTVVTIALIMVFALALLFRNGSYTNRRRISRFSDVGAVVKYLVLGAAATMLLMYLTKGFFTGHTSPSRLATGSYLLIFFLLSVLSRILLRFYQRRLFAEGRTVSKILLVGVGETAQDFLQFVSHRPWLGVSVAGQIVYGPNGVEHADHEGIPLAHVTNNLQGLGHLDEMLRASGAAEVVVALEPSEQSELPDIVHLLTLAHVPFKVVPSLFEQSYRATELLGYAEIPVIDVQVDPLDRVARLFKRALDITVAVTALLVLLPLELLIVLAIVAESGLPVIYTQERVGKNARRFRFYKFRTMVKDADQHLDELAAQNEAGSDGRMFKIRMDPRVTRVGRILRRFSLDELPQLVNVLKKDMSMVGPRPPLPAEVQKYEYEHIYRLRATPGMTGLWQISGRSDLGFDDMVKLDRFYLDHWSVQMDAGILLRTIFVIVSRRGAY